ncbi:PREDICTED: LYR motif-containing protein 2 isoform X1 [Dipodomys ordii]|uniref:LYR motif-containing protein 2 n=1 Tax=Dipodomys ordii TaxID=10020 RepID=A0A1S3F5Y3_DIPOR|nr:PREDICTED: LYR motif-containing protein 2 isoform X1 [Dipodomys ordii]
MAASRLPPATLTLKQFMRRQQVLHLYRRILQAIRQVPNDSDRKYLKDWAREEFKRNKGATEELFPTSAESFQPQLKHDLQDSRTADSSLSLERPAGAFAYFSPQHRGKHTPSPKNQT